MGFNELDEKMCSWTMFRSEQPSTEMKGKTMKIDRTIRRMLMQMREEDEDEV